HSITSTVVISFDAPRSGFCTTRTLKVFSAAPACKYEFANIVLNSKILTLLLSAHLYTPEWAPLTSAIDAVFSSFSRLTKHDNIEFSDS
ncbi:hypothetical protein PFISCL1PPCAC_22456, partial [Pristionchus fissidentatus]